MTILESNDGWIYIKYIYSLLLNILFFLLWICLKFFIMKSWGFGLLNFKWVVSTQVKAIRLSSMWVFPSFTHILNDCRSQMRGMSRWWRKQQSKWSGENSGSWYPPLCWGWVGSYRTVTNGISHTCSSKGEGNVAMWE